MMVTFGIEEGPPLMALQEGYSTLLRLVGFSFSLTVDDEVTPARAELYRRNSHPGLQGEHHHRLSFLRTSATKKGQTQPDVQGRVDHKAV
jgi:hypothetical protein